MTGVEVAMVGLAGAVGAVVRDLATRGRGRDAVAVLNAVGSLLLGAASALPDLGPPATTVLAGGLLGAMTTFSAWAVAAGAGPRPVRWATGTLLAAVAAAAAGRALVRMVA